MELINIKKFDEFVNENEESINEASTPVRSKTIKLGGKEKYSSYVEITFMELPPSMKGNNEILRINVKGFISSRGPFETSWQGASGKNDIDDVFKNVK